MVTKWTGQGQIAMTDSSTRHRTAVIAVHGVADQTEFSTLYSTSNLLSSPHLEGCYSEFVEEDIVIPQRAVQLGAFIDTQSDTTALLRNLLPSRVSQASAKQIPSLHYVGAEPVDLSQRTAEEIEHESMREQLQDFEEDPESAVHATKKLRGKRCKGDNPDNWDDVDLYELHWSDISRLKSGLLSVFFEFYLFLFFFPRLGGTTMERAIGVMKQSRLYALNLGCHRMAEKALVVGVPITHLCLLSLIASGLPILLQPWLFDSPDRMKQVSVVLLLVVGLGIGAGFSFKNKFAGWAAIFWVVTLVTGVCIYTDLIPAANIKILTFVSWLLLAGVVLLLCKAYDKRRHGAFRFGLIAVLLTGVVFLSTLIFDGFAVAISRIADSLVNSPAVARLALPEMILADQPAVEIFNRGFAALLVVLTLNLGAWIVFIVGAVGQSLFGFWSTRGGSHAEIEKVRGAVWTGVISLVLPGITILLVTFFLWEIVVWTSRPLIEQPQYGLLRTLIDLNIFPHIELVILVLGIAVGYAVWLIIPAATSEFSKGGARQGTSRPPSG